jgi:hypothetical protein
MRFRRGVRWCMTMACLGAVVPLLALGSSAGAAPLAGQGSSLQPKVVDVTNNPGFIMGEPEVAINPTNPKNLVYVVTQIGLTPTCIMSGNPNCQQVSTVFGPQPAGLVHNVPGFSPNGIYVSMDGGKTWKSVTVPTIKPPQSNPNSGLLNAGDPGITVGPNGTFYFSEDVTHFCDTPSVCATTISPDGGVATSTSTDGGRTWTRPVLSMTPGDRPFITADTSTGTVYVESGEGPLGPGSTTDPNAPTSTLSGRWLVSSKNGVHWTAPAFLGAGILGPWISAGNGVFASGGASSGPTYCGALPTCEVFETTKDAGLVWTVHVIPNSSDSSAGPLIAASPTRPGHFTVAYLNAASTAMYVTQTTNSGRTWSRPTVVTENPSLTQWKPWIAYSPDGSTVGLMWRTWQGPVDTSPYSVWAAVSRNGGSSFTPPLEVSNGTSPAPSPELPVLPGTQFADDFSFIALSGQTVYVAWADWRTNDAAGNPARQGFISITNLRAFNSR